MHDLPRGTPRHDRPGEDVRVPRLAAPDPRGRARRRRPRPARAHANGDPVPARRRRGDRSRDPGRNRAEGARRAGAGGAAAPARAVRPQPSERPTRGGLRRRPRARRGNACGRGSDRLTPTPPTPVTPPSPERLGGKPRLPAVVRRAASLDSCCRTGRLVLWSRAGRVCHKGPPFGASAAPDSRSRVARRARLRGRARGGGRRHRPAGVPGFGRPERVHEPDGRPLRRRRPRLRGREERDHQGLRRPERPDADDVREPERQRPQLLGPRPARDGARAELPRGSVGLRPLHVRRRDRRRRAALGDARRPLRRVSDPARADDRRLRRLRAALAPAGERERDDRQRAGADRGLVPAVPEPLGRHDRVRLPTARSTSPAATARASTSPTGARRASRATRAPTRRAPTRLRRRPRAGRSAARISARRRTRTPSTARSRASTR